MVLTVFGLVVSLFCFFSLSELKSREQYLVEIRLVAM